jgi:hypothetical protein
MKLKGIALTRVIRPPMAKGKHGEFEKGEESGTSLGICSLCDLIWRFRRHKAVTFVWGFISLHQPLFVF